MEEFGFAHRSVLFKTFVKKWPQHIVKQRKGKTGYGNRGEIFLSEEGYKQIRNYYKHRKKRPSPTGPGFIYCFLALANYFSGKSYCMKIGRTHDLKERFKQYNGLNKVTQVLEIYPTDNMLMGEKKMLKEFRRHYTNIQGTNEWFILPRDGIEEAKKLFCFKLYEDVAVSY